METAEKSQNKQLLMSFASIQGEFEMVPDDAASLHHSNSMLVVLVAVINNLGGNANNNKCLPRLNAGLI